MFAGLATRTGTNCPNSAERIEQTGGARCASGCFNAVDRQVGSPARADPNRGLVGFVAALAPDGVPALAVLFGRDLRGAVAGEAALFAQGRSGVGQLGLHVVQKGQVLARLEADD